MKRRVLLPIIGDGVRIEDDVYIIPIQKFLDKVLEVSKSEELAKNANSKKSFDSETTMIQTCLNKDGKKRFNFEIIDQGEEGKPSSMSSYQITFDIPAGGRRSKTRRTKKGKRKGTRRRQRGYRRS